MEHRGAELRRAEPCDAARDDPARFLRELRQLRGGAGLGHAELAARAHYPCDAIRAAEAGPSLPDLPMLSAYVRGCGGTIAEWEDRWRSLTRSPALPLLPARSAGCSDAATAGARVGSTSPAAGGHDPALIMAALGRVANGMAAAAQADTPVAGASRSKPATVAAAGGTPMAAGGAAPEAADAGVASGVGAAPDGGVALAAPGAGAAAGYVAAPGSGPASRAEVPSAVSPLPASGQVGAGRRHLLPPRTVVAALVVALVVAVVAAVVVVIVAVLALFA